MTAWTAIADSEIDPDSPGKAALAQKFVDNNQHLYEFLTGGSTRYDDRIPHDHSALQDLEVSPVCGPNLLNWPCPTSASNGWTGSGVAAGTGGTIKMGTSGSAYLYQPLATSPGATAVQTMFGSAGSPMVIAFYVRATATLTQGQLEFGFGNNITTPHSNYKANVDWQDIAGTAGTSTSWTRFWSFMDESSPATQGHPGNSTTFTTNVRAIWDIQTAFNANVELSGFMVYQTNVAFLLPFNYGPQEYRARKYGQAPSASDGVPTDAPLWDRAVAITNAVQVNRS